MDNRCRIIRLIKPAVIFGLMVMFLAGCAVLGGSSKGKFVKAHPEISGEIKEAIRSGQLVMGMSKEMVLASKGKPDSTHAYKHEDKIIETWTYRGGLFGKGAYVKFEDGKVTGWDIR